MIPISILLVVGLYGLVHSWMASLGVKAAVRQRLGPTADRYYRLAFNIFGFISLIPVLALPVLLPDRRLYSIPFPWDLPLLALQAAALIGLAVGVKETGAWSFLGLEQLFEEQPSKSTLVTSGLYRWVRHPLYSAGMVFIWASPVMTRDMLSLFLGLTAYLIVGALFEERKLLREYGSVYATYRDQTPMFIPGLKGTSRQ
ncbi:MAG TPA: isoprenylcysteine carboxylmethyltransferase family protein [Anaerolineales bacterium]